MDTIKKIFVSKKPIIGMLHLSYLEGRNFINVGGVVKKAIKDIEILQTGGIDGILIENWKEESVGEFVSEETANNFTKVMAIISKEIKVPFGINVLNNDYKLGFKLAKDFGAAFVELDVFVDKVKSAFVNNQNAMKTPFIINPDPNIIWNYARSICAENIPLFCFVQPKHYEMLEKNKTHKKSISQAIKNGASAVLITKATGFAPTFNLIKKAKTAAGDFPVGIGSGFSSENTKEILPYVDFAVVGTSIKKNNKTDNPIDINKVRELMKVVKYSRI